MHHVLRNLIGFFLLLVPANGAATQGLTCSDAIVLELDGPSLSYTLDCALTACNYNGVNCPCATEVPALNNPPTDFITGKSPDPWSRGLWFTFTVPQNLAVGASTVISTFSSVTNFGTTLTLYDACPSSQAAAEVTSLAWAVGSGSPRYGNVSGSTPLRDVVAAPGSGCGAPRSACATLQSALLTGGTTYYLLVNADADPGLPSATENPIWTNSIFAIAALTQPAITVNVPITAPTTTVTCLTTANSVCPTPLSTIGVSCGTEPAIGCQPDPACVMGCLTNTSCASDTCLAGCTWSDFSSECYSYRSWQCCEYSYGAWASLPNAACWTSGLQCFPTFVDGYDIIVVDFFDWWAPPPPPPATPGLPTTEVGLIVGIVLFGILAVVLAALFVFCFFFRRKAAVAPTQVVIEAEMGTRSKSKKSKKVNPLPSSSEVEASEEREAEEDEEEEESS